MKQLTKTCMLASALFAAVALLTSCPPATAQCGGGYGGYAGFGGFAGPFGIGFGGISSPYATGRIPTPPYFALHPPVYYSGPVPRAYGFSPFPYSGDVPTPEIAPIMPVAKMTINPYVEQTVADEAASSQPDLEDSASSQPLMIVNPYVTHEPAIKVQLARVDYVE